MNVTTQHFTQVSSIFGSGYVPEQHGEQSRSYLPPIEGHEPIVDFEELLKTLRAALSLR
jgi:hypothetical protein